MKKNIISKWVAVVALLTSVSLFSACDNKDNALWWSDVVYIQGAQDHAASIEVGQTLQLSATTRDGQAVVWESSNPEVATVSEDGLVTAISYGQAIITAYPKDFFGGENGNYIEVTVQDISMPFADDRIDQSEAE